MPLLTDRPATDGTEVGQTLNELKFTADTNYNHNIIAGVKWDIWKAGT